MIKDLITNRELIGSLAKNDFKTKFAGSIFGIIWAFVQPVVTIFVYWFVFEKALSIGSGVGKEGIEVPFALWLTAGIIPWFFFSDALNGGTNALMEYSYLVKKVVFNIDILPIVKVASNLFVHVFFVVFAVILFAVFGYMPDLYILQVFYYSFCLIVLVIGLTYITSAIAVFFKDMTQIINILLQIGVWATPIMWNIETAKFSPALLNILKLNPMYYIVQGYRDAFIKQVAFWEKPGLTLYFWCFTLIILFLGNRVFKKLKPHFADVL